MSLLENPTHYDILDLRPDASPHEIREAYLRAKAAYNKDSVALYSLLDADDTREMLQKIEEAYRVLSNSKSRREYDRYYGLLESERDEFEIPVQPVKKVISIDRFPPMETENHEEDLLVAPTTDFSDQSAPKRKEKDFEKEREIFLKEEAVYQKQPEGLSEDRNLLNSQPSSQATGPSIPSTHQHSQSIGVDTKHRALMQEIEKEVDWRGTFLRKMREARQVSIEELAQITRISKTYIIAIEEDNFAKLPASVFVRGFLIQIARVLKLPPEKLATAYMLRFNEAKPAKTR